MQARGSPSGRNLGLDRGNDCAAGPEAKERQVLFGTRGRILHCRWVESSSLLTGSMTKGRTQLEKGTG
jgi:hypothetical protein